MPADRDAVARASLQRALLVIVLAALGAAIVAQRLLDHGNVMAGLLLGIGSGALFGWASASVPIGAVVLPTVAVQRALTARQRLLAMAGLACALVGCALLEPNRFTSSGTILWLTGITLLFVAVRESPQKTAAGFPNHGARPAVLGVLSVLGVIIATAAYFRVHRLIDLPAEAGCDIPLKLQIVRGILAGDRPIFSTIYPGREAAFFYVTALYGALFGADQAALKVVSVCFSLASVVLICLLGARWFGLAAGLSAAAWLALSPWHVTISRIGYRGVMTPFMVALTLLALDRARTYQTRQSWALLGITVGAGLYTYTAYSAVVAVLAVVAILDLIRSRSRAKSWAFAVILAVLLSLPMLRFATADPSSFMARAGSRLTEGDQHYELGPRVLENAASSLGMFNVRGDPIATQNTPGRRMLGAASGALFFLAVGVALSRVRQPLWAFTLFLLIALQLPAALVLSFPAEVPAAVRASGALIPAYLLIGVPLIVIWRVADARRSRATLAVCVVFFVGLFLAEAGETWRRYFVEYAEAQPFGNYPMTRTIAAVIDEHVERGDAYIPAYPYWIDGNAVRMQLQRMPIERCHELDGAALDALLATPLPKPALFILKPDDEGLVTRLRSLFARGGAVPYHDRLGTPMFVAFYAGS